MPRGGARVGAGRKPKAEKGRRSSAVAAGSPPNIVSIEGGRAGELSKAPPANLPEDQQDFWRTYAPLAIDAGTLTKQTEASFRLLCELDAEKRATKETLDRDGRTFIRVTVDGAGQEHQELKAHPLTGSYRQLAQRVETLMARFLLAPFGKPLEGKKKGSATSSPWMAITSAKRSASGA
jgi:hypothetical protein